MFRRIAVLLPMVWGLTAVGQNTLIEPPVFQSQNHVLDLLMVAKEKPIQLAGLNPTAWVYEVCPRSISANDQCPKGSQTFSPYGGVRLQLQAGDHLKIRYVNALPPSAADAKHVADDPMLAGNPINLHTHGLIVEPRRAGQGDPTYGDYVYVYQYPAGLKPGDAMPGIDITDKPVDYDIYIPQNHPSGNFWFHPHTHGLSLNQMSKGLAGIITIGSPSDYLGDVAGRFGFTAPKNVRHLILKDMEVEADNSVDDQEDPAFCNGDPDTGEAARNGSCPGVVIENDDGTLTDHTNGKWVMSVNGQVFPTINVTRGTGEIWAMTNASGSRSYELVLKDDKTGQPLQFQVLSLDGIALDAAAGTDVSALLSGKVGRKINPSACNGSLLSSRISQPVCTTAIRMMPSSRVEIYISSRQADFSKSATLATQSFQTGPAGDDWPAANLAHVNFLPGTGAIADTLEVKGGASQAFAANGVLTAPAYLSFKGVTNAIPYEIAKQIASGSLSASNPLLASALGDATTAKQLASLSAGDLANFAAKVKAVQDPNCKALPAGHRRRIYFGVPTDADFGLGYEEIDARGNAVPGTQQDMKPFDHAGITVCLPLGPQNRPVTEEWELINVAGEDHNFHIHQTKFKVLKDAGSLPGDGGALMDNVPVPHGSDGCDGTIDSWKSGACTVNPVHVSIPFSQIGDFVYHCHILEHEDGGMMAHIKVVAH
jgi:L-ascorbate oxidase